MRPWFADAGWALRCIARAPPPLQSQLETPGKKLVVVSATICGLVFVLGLLRG
jgi:hypothetical protein